MSDETYFHQLLVLFWAQFGAGARMPFALECVEVARRAEPVGAGDPDGLGYYDNIESRLAWFKEHPDEVSRALVCCERAGRLAAANAVKDEVEEISALHFAKACRKVEKIVTRARNRSVQLVGGKSFAGVCG